jgi:hypothetical protein
VGTGEGVTSGRRAIGKRTVVKIRAECSVYRDIRNARSQSARVEFGAELKQVAFVVVAFRLLIVIVFVILMYSD